MNKGAESGTSSADLRWVNLGPSGMSVGSTAGTNVLDPQPLVDGLLVGEKDFPRRVMISGGFNDWPKLKDGTSRELDVCAETAKGT